METLDLLISKFQEFKAELQKNNPLHDTVSGFMTGLKTLPKGSPERGKFITAHMNHGPFLTALSAHPQGKQMHGMLTSHLNSAANAGFKQGKTMAVAKSDEDVVEKLEKAMGMLRTSVNAGAEAAAAHRNALINKPVLPTPAKQAMPSATEHAARANMYADFMPGVKKTVNASYAPEANMAMSRQEKMTLNKHGQWDIVYPEADKKAARVGVNIDKAEDKKEMVGVNVEKSNDEEDSLQKAYISPFRRYGPAKVNKPVAKPASTVAPPKKLTGLDRIKAESQRPIEAMDAKVKKDEDDVEKDADGAGVSVQRPEHMQLSRGSSVNMHKNNEQWSTDETLEKKHIGFKKLQGKLEGEGHSEESSAKIAASIGRKKYGAKGMAEMAHKTEDKMEKDGLQDAIKNLKSSTKVTGAMNSLRGKQPGMPTASVLKDEMCSSCKKTPCSCAKKFDAPADGIGGGI